MGNEAQLREQLAAILADYRAPDIAPRDPDVIERWLRQFEADVRLPLLQELTHVLGETYLSRHRATALLESLCSRPEIAGPNPAAFWQQAHLLRIQRRGHSQSAMLELFRERPMSQLHVHSAATPPPGGHFVYLDDVLYTGERALRDLSGWIDNERPEGTLHIILLAAHRFGAYECKRKLKIGDSPLQLRIHVGVYLENRRAKSASSQVLWPTDAPASLLWGEYASTLNERQLAWRAAGPRTPEPFGSESGRRLLERELLLAGLRIRSFCQSPLAILRPLGFGPFGVGFGSTIVTWRNCPNNAPLALWWGGEHMGPNHPFSKWFPLVPRAVNDAEAN